MASRTSLAVLLLASLLSHWSRALQVTPNSPCASTCIDSTALDPSDPNSSNTRNADITCQDSNYGSSATGIKWRNCMSCLQNSTFSQGSENDQMWFLYNMRYSLSSCIFGFPNATNTTTSPCLTSFACEPLTKPLEDGLFTPSGSTQYGYCSIDADAGPHQVFSRCASCVGAGGETQYLANYLVALDAGCSQRPAPGHILGLNGSVFSRTAIGIVDPALITPTATPNSGSAGLPSNIIAAIISVVLIILLIAAAFFFIRFKKRQNRRKRASYAARFKAWGGSSHSHMPQSPLSFQCKTQMGPTSPKFFDDNEDLPTTSLSRKPSHGTGHNVATSFQPISAVTETTTTSSSPSWPLPKRESSFSHQNPLRYHPSNHPVPLHSLNTDPTVLPSYPTPTHASPLSSSQARFSPDSYTVTPTSTVSTRSNAPLLPYIPAQHAAVPSLRGPHNIAPTTTTAPAATAPTTGTGAGAGASAQTPSPLLRGVPTFSRDITAAAASPRPESSASTLPPVPAPPPPPKSPRMVVGVAIDGVEGLVNFKVAPRRKATGGKGRESGSPVESRTVVSVFPPPPPPPRR